MGTEKIRLIAFHKPFRVLCQFTQASDTVGKDTLKKFIAVPDVYPCGRLDYDSEGLLLLTDDGNLQHRISAPEAKLPKTYLVQVEGIPDEEAIQRLRTGVELDGRMTLPARVRAVEAPHPLPDRNPPIRVRRNIPDSWLEIILTEGRNRQVRRMTAAVGYPTLRLIRWAIGPITLEGLVPGQWRAVDPSLLLK